MFKRFDYKVANENYIVYVIENNGEYEYWLTKENYGIMYLMFGTKEYDLSLIENNLLDYVKTYEEEFGE